jgi:hypothetical protein
MLVHGLAPAPDLHLGYTVPSVRSCLRGVVRLNYSPIRGALKQPTPENPTDLALNLLSGAARLPTPAVRGRPLGVVSRCSPTTQCAAELLAGDYASGQVSVKVAIG